MQTLAAARGKPVTWFWQALPFDTHAKQVRIWVVDVAEEFPNAELHGYDISSSQFPPPEYRPSNVTLSTLDALAPVPQDLVEAYDIVHVGLLVIVARSDPLALLDNLLRMLSETSLHSYEDVRDP